MFAIDPRSLAAFRIGIALLILCDLFNRAGDLQAFYADDGLLPRTARLEMLGYGDPLGFQHQWSIHLLNGQWWSQALLAGMSALFAAWLLVGYRTQLAAILSWILVVSTEYRNPMITDAGDSILRALLFWSLFLPLGLCWSVDRALLNQSPDDPAENQSAPINSVLSAVLLLQLAIMYWASAAFKWHPVWIHDFSAVHYALQADTLAKPVGIFLREHLAVMRWLTAATVLIEICAPLLAFSPWGNRWCRGIAIVILVAFHGGLSATLALGLFPWICITGWLLFVPTSFWNWIGQKQSLRKLEHGIRKLLMRCLELLPDRSRNALKRRAEIPRAKSGKWRELLVGLLFLYVVIWNVREIIGSSRAEQVMPHRFNGLACALGLAQNWSMFAPIPRMDDGWLVMKGTCRDGTAVNLWAPDQPLSWDKPQLVSEMFPSSRWRSYLQAVTLEQFAFHRQHFAHWLKRRWDREQAAGAPERMIAKVEIIWQMEATPPPGEPIPKPEPVELCVRHYE
jgi:hypothetical protein